MEDGHEKLNGLIRGFRAWNHFHDPTSSFSDAGLNNFKFNALSAVVWAKYSDENYWDIENFWDLEDFIEYYEKSFTSETLADRLDYLSDTFRATGHMMHLLQDMAVPAHVRNEFYSGHTIKQIWSFPPGTSPTEYYLQHNPEFIETVTPDTIPSFDDFTDYYDTGQYRSDTSQPVAGPAYGLAEYINSNFLSEVQRFLNGTQSWPYPYPHPNLSHVSYYDEQQDRLSNHYIHLRWVLPELFYASYLRKASTDPEQQLEHFARASYLKKYLKYSHTVAFLDETCHIEYLNKLVPKAVAYSAGLLEYLFRGDIDFTLDFASDTTMEIANNSDQDMSGDFTLYYDSNKDKRKEMDGASWNLSIPAGGTADVLVPGRGTPKDLGVEKSFTLVFRGLQGGADEIVAGKTSTLAPYEFDFRQEFDHFQLNYPTVSTYTHYLEDMTRSHEYHCDMSNTHGLSDSTIARRVAFFLNVKMTPDLAKKLGYDYVEGAVITINTSTHHDPGVVEYLTFYPTEFDPVVVYSGGGILHDEGWADVANPLSYMEGLWKPETGYIDEYWSLPNYGNNISQCHPTEGTGVPTVDIDLLYDVDEDTGQYVPQCYNADEILDTAASTCASYIPFYHYAVGRARDYYDLLRDPDWENYGFEVRLNRLADWMPKRGDGMIYDGPVTFTKPYGSNALFVQ